MYLSWKEKKINDFSDENLFSLYDQAYVFTRIGKGEMKQIRSIRINLKKFELSSENRRILKKVNNVKMEICELPYADYDWSTLIYLNPLGFNAKYVLNK